MLRILPAKSYIYFVSYAFKNTGGYGYGYAEVPTIAPITHVENLRAVQKGIEEKLLLEGGRNTSVTILNFQLLRKE